MTGGHVVKTMVIPHECAPGWVWKPITEGMLALRVGGGVGGRYGVPPTVWQYPAGTVWGCEDCGDNPERVVTVWPSSLSFSSTSRMIEQAREVHGPDVQVRIGEYPAIGVEGGAPGGIVRFPRSVSREQVERFMSAFDEAYPRGRRYEIEMEEQRPRRRWWRWWR